MIVRHLTPSSLRLTYHPSIQSTFFNKVMAGDALGKGISTPFIGFLPINFTVTLI